MFTWRYYQLLLINHLAEELKLLHLKLSYGRTQSHVKTIIIQQATHKVELKINKTKTMASSVPSEVVEIVYKLTNIST